MTSSTTYLVSRCDLCTESMGKAMPTLEEQIKKLEENGWLHLPRTNQCVCPKCIDRIRRFLRMGLMTLTPEGQQTVLARMQLDMSF